MSAVPADLAISARWVLPMTSPTAALEQHTLVVRDGRILDIVPTAVAMQRYAPADRIERAHHLLMPGLVNAFTCIAPAAGRVIGREQLADAAQLCMAEMLLSGTTCFCSVGHYPAESARVAADLGLRALIGMPIDDNVSAWAGGAAEYLTRALDFRDEYRGHPTIATAFAPCSVVTLSDATFVRIATVADELDAGIVMPLHESRADLEACVARHGRRPLERLNALGMLTPSLTAANAGPVSAADVELALRGGIALALCPEAQLRAGQGVPPIAAWIATGLRLGLGSGARTPSGNLDLWSAMRLLALLSQAVDGGSAATMPENALAAWDALAAATRGGAAALGLDAEIGTLETGKWADFCCIDLHAPALQWPWRDPARDVAPYLVYHGGRSQVSDVWVSGRQLVNTGTLTRLDWPEIAARMSGRERANPGERP